MAKCRIVSPDSDRSYSNDCTLEEGHSGLCSWERDGGLHAQREPEADGSDGWAGFGPGGCVRREPDLGPMFPSLIDHVPTLNDYAEQSHEDNMQWWLDLETGEKLVRNKGELLALIHSEISEALEGVRKGLMDDKLPHRTMEEVELADALIRIFDYAGAHGLDIEGAYQEKRAYNKQRADHKPENRAAEGGKKF